MQQITDILPKMVESLGIQKQYKTQLILFYWDKIVGPDIAAQSFPVNVEYGVLFLCVDNSVWCHHLSMMKTDLIQKVNQFIGEALVRDIRFKNHLFRRARAEEDGDKEEKSIGAQLKRVRLEPEEEWRVDAECADIKEDRVKACISRLYRKHLKFNKLKKNSNWHKCAGCDTLCPEDRQYCHVCELERRHINLSKIRQALSDVPWATYAEINRHIPCTPQEYIDAKVTLLHLVSGRIGKEEAYGIEAKMLTMLFTGAKHDALSDRLIQKTLAKFRRKAYVSAFRS